MDNGLSSSYLLLKSTEKETFLRDCQLREGSGILCDRGSGIRAHYLEMKPGNETWKWSFIVDLSACFIVDGLINLIVLAWLMIGC